MSDTFNRCIRFAMFAAMLACTGRLASLAGEAAGIEFRALLVGAVVCAFTIGSLSK